MVRDVDIPGGGTIQGIAHAAERMRTVVDFSTKLGKKTARDGAFEYLKMLRQAITDLQNPPRRPATILIHGLQRRRLGPLIVTGRYRALQRVRKTQDSRDFVLYEIGSFEQDIHPPSGLNMARLARILERGNPANLVFGRIPGPIPARPHHRPTFRKFYSKILPKRYKREMDVLVRHLWR